MARAAMNDAKSSNPFDDISGPPDQAIEGVLDLLEIKGEGTRRAKARVLKASVKAFELSRAYTAYFGSTHEAIRQLGHLHDLLEETKRTMMSLRPDVQGMLQNLSEPPYSRADWEALHDGIHKLRQVCAKAKGATLPKRLRSHGDLDRAVAHLLLRMRDITGTIGKARRADKRYDRPARLASKEAEAIWMLLRHIDGVTESVVANRIVHLRKLHGDRLEEEYPEYLVMGGRVRFLSKAD